jgi:hypothetical protein
MNSLYLSPAMLTCFANDNDAFIPEKWAMEGLMFLEENMVMAGLVHRDFENEIREFGDVVNTRRPAPRVGRRRTDADNYVARDVSATNVRVPLDQWFYDSFIIKDGESSKSFQDLITVHLHPAMVKIANQVDRAVLGRVHNFTKTPAARVGRLLNLSASNARDYVLEAGELLDIQLAPVTGRNLCFTPTSQTALLKTDLFVKANERGDGGNALANARLGHILNFDTYMSQNVNRSGTANAEIATGTVTNALAAEGSGSQTVSIVGYEAVVGEYATADQHDCRHAQRSEQVRDVGHGRHHGLQVAGRGRRAPRRSLDLRPR